MSNTGMITGAQVEMEAATNSRRSPDESAWGNRREEFQRKCFDLGSRLEQAKCEDEMLSVSRDFLNLFISVADPKYGAGRQRIFLSRLLLIDKINFWAKNTAKQITVEIGARGVYRAAIIDSSGARLCFASAS